MLSSAKVVTNCIVYGSVGEPISFGDKTLTLCKMSSVFLAKQSNQSWVFHDPLVSLIFEGFDPQILPNDPQNLLFTFFNSYEGGHCDPINRKLGETLPISKVNLRK